MRHTDAWFAICTVRTVRLAAAVCGVDGLIYRKNDVRDRNGAS